MPRLTFLMFASLFLFFLKRNHTRSLKRAPELSLQRRGSKKWLFRLPLILGITLGTALTGIFESPFPGLLGLLCGLALARGAETLLIKQTRNKLNEGSLSLVASLKPLLETGMGFPQALFLLTSQDTLFAKALSQHLKKFDNGRTFLFCLETFQTKYPGLLFAPLFTSLRLAYEEGCSLLPIVKQSLPLMEWRFSFQEKIRRLLKNALGQALMALLLPYLLLLVLFVSTPSVLIQFFSSPLCSLVFLVTFLIQGLGFLCVKKLCAY